MALTYEPIATTTLGSATPSITFSSIPNTYTDLRLVYVGGTAGVWINITFNGSSATNYSWTQMQAGSSSVTTTSSQNSAFIQLRSDSSTSIFSLRTIDLFSYAGSTNKTILATDSNDVNASGGGLRHTVGLWRNTSAITSITLTASSGNISTGTTATLYGIKAA